jgi:hypothetical protein
VATIDRFSGLRIVIYSNDHRPPHVHVIGAECEAVFELNCPDGPVMLRENYGFSRAEIGQIRRELARRIGELCRRWSEIHG